MKKLLTFVAVCLIFSFSVLGAVPSTYTDISADSSVTVTTSNCHYEKALYIKGFWCFGDSSDSFFVFFLDFSLIFISPLYLHIKFSEIPIEVIRTVTTVTPPSKSLMV